MDQAIDLRLTLESGQFFRWHPQGDGFCVMTHGRSFFVAERDGGLRVRGTSATFARKFFALDHDLPAIRETLARDPKLRSAVRPGLRILRQDPWECLVAFVTSCASNIPRITKNLAALCGDGPTPRKLDERALRRLGFGFRSRYLSRISPVDLQGLDALSTGDARDRLCELPGVAEKVADCVLLFGYGRLEAFPLDVWIRRVMRDRFLRGTDREIRAFAADRWGPLAGYAQQFLYVWSRNG